MPGFRKAKAEQAAIKMGLYGLAGSGKTFTALLCAEGLARIAKKRIAFVDTERGTDFYCKAVKNRPIHPDAFDFDAIYTKSITEVLSELRSLDQSKYGVVVIDSITHIWEAARLAYSGKTTNIGTIPFHAWAQIKKPYKEMMAILLSLPIHVFICGRQGNEFSEDEDTGELKKVGVKMKAEGETPYEPHILINLETVRNKQGDGIITAFAEKDRTGVLAGRSIQWPNFERLIEPILPLLGGEQAHVATDEETAANDAEALADSEDKKAKESARVLERFKAKLMLCETEEQVKKTGAEITKEVKATMMPSHVTELRELFLSKQEEKKGA